MISLLKGLALLGGEWVIYLLVFCSVLSIAIMIERYFILNEERKEMKKVKKVFEGLPSLFAISDLKEGLNGIDGSSATILKKGIEQASLGRDSAEEWIISDATLEKNKLEKRLIILGTLGNNAIYIGLFGTVLGVIKAFHDLAQNSGLGPEVVMQGLSEALVATAIGLLVAIPSVIAYNFFQKSVKDILTDTDSMARVVLAKIEKV